MQISSTYNSYNRRPKRQKDNLHTNLTAANSFKKAEKLSGIKRWMNPSEYYFHVTSFSNIPSIIKSGLDPEKGGDGGAGDKFKLDGFKEASQNFVHAAKDEKSASKYVNLYELDSFKSGYGFSNEEPDSLKDCAVVLRFSKNLENLNWVKDEDDPESFKTNNPIKPENIEALTTEGWVSVSSLTEVKDALPISASLAKKLEAEAAAELRKKYMPFNSNVPYYYGGFSG